MTFSGKNDDKTIFAGILEAALHRFGLQLIFLKKEYVTKNAENSLSSLLGVLPAFNGGRS